MKQLPLISIISHEKFTKLIVLGAVALGGHYISLMNPKNNNKNDAKSELKLGEKILGEKILCEKILCETESISQTVTKKVYLYVKSIEEESERMRGLMNGFNEIDMNSSFVKESIRQTIECALSQSKLD